MIITCPIVHGMVNIDEIKIGIKKKTIVFKFSKRLFKDSRIEIKSISQYYIKITYKYYLK